MERERRKRRAESRHGSVSPAGARGRPLVYSVDSPEVRVTRVGGAAWVVLALTVPVAARAVDAAPEQIASWIEQLGAPQFARREAASQQLLRAGRPALEPLARVLGSGDLEVASRALEVIRGMLAGSDAELAEEAERLLERSAERQPPPVSQLAEAVLEFHVLGRGEEARRQLEARGAILRDRPAIEGPGLEVEIGGSWRGGLDDLRQLARLPDLDAVSIRGVRVDPDGVAVLGRLRRLRRLELFGTGLGPETAEALATRLPDTRIDVRKGGRLGVSSLAFGGPCEIRIVEPGSAADQAGIRSGDVVEAVDGTPVTDFEALTVRLAALEPGATVRLAVSREGGPDGAAERLELTVRLDAW